MDYLNGDSEPAAEVKARPKIHDKNQYYSLPSADDSDISNIPSLSRRNRHPAYLSYLPTLLILVTLIVSSIHLGQLTSLKRAVFVEKDVTQPSISNTVQNPTGRELGHCGKSVSEARSLGCVFDPMSWAWQRPECYHAELVTEFLDRMEWNFYSSNDTSDPTKKIPREQWERGDHIALWGPRMWHNFHCTYSWRKFHEAFTKRLPMDNDILKLQHTMHCATIFLHDYDPLLTAPCDSWPGGCQTTELHAGFNECGWY